MRPACRYASQSVHHSADATKEFLLDNEGISDCDALVTLTGVDEMNIIISLYGSSCKVPQIITKLGRLENNTILDSCRWQYYQPQRAEL